MKSYNLDKLRSQQQKLEADKTTNENELSGMDDKDPRFNELVQEGKKLDTEITTNQNELGAAEKEAKESTLKAQADKVTEQMKGKVQEAKEAENPTHATPVAADPSKTNSEQPELDANTAERIESTQQGQGNNYEELQTSEVQKDSLDKYPSRSPAPEEQQQQLEKEKEELETGDDRDDR